MTASGGGKAQTKKEKTLKLDFAKKEENDLPIVSAKQDTLLEVKLELENKESKLDIPSGLFDYSSNNVFTKVKDIFLEIEKENRVNEQKQQIQKFEELARSVKNAIPKVFEKLIDKIPKSFLSKNEAGGGHLSSSDDSSGEQDPAIMTPFQDNIGDTRGQQLEEFKNEDENEEKKTKTEEMDNCVIDSFAIKKILQIKVDESEYYLVSCTRESMENDGDFGKHWGGAFPKTLFNSLNLTKPSRLDIEVRIDYDSLATDEEYLFSIEFESDQFSGTEGSKITGDFNYEAEGQISLNNTGAIVKLTTTPANKKLIYLLMDLDKSN